MYLLLPLKYYCVTLCLFIDSLSTHRVQTELHLSDLTNNRQCVKILILGHLNGGDNSLATGNTIVCD